MYKECPICGRPFSALDVVLLESDIGFQCHNCWNRVHATGPVHRGMPMLRHESLGPLPGTARPATAEHGRRERPRRKK
jgi:hypothetical protein